MSTVKEIVSAVSKLSRAELQSFRAWFQEFDADAWDRQFEEDVRAGLLDALAMLPLAVPGLVLAFGYLAISGAFDLRLLFICLLIRR
jgi:hypothetical protein